MLLEQVSWAPLEVVAVGRKVKCPSRGEYQDRSWRRLLLMMEIPNHPSRQRMEVLLSYYLEYQ
jgi:hypothetical protein